MTCCVDMEVNWGEIDVDEMGRPIYEGECGNCGETMRETWTEKVHEVVNE